MPNVSNTTEQLDGIIAVPKDFNEEIDMSQFKFLDLHKPLLPALWNGNFRKSFYLEQVHRPRHYPGGGSAPLFGNFLEPLSKGSLWVQVFCLLPLTVYGTYIANLGLPLSKRTAEYWLLGFLLWPLLEYSIHRWVFHCDRYLPDHRVAITTHFLLHGISHYLPMDKGRLVKPPALILVFAAPLYWLTHLLFFWSWHAATATFCGALSGYLYFEVFHYFLHNRPLDKPPPKFL